MLIADDHGLMVEAVRLALAAERDLEVVGATTEPTRIQRLVRELRPEVLLLDVLMPGLDGISVLKRVRREFPELVVVMLSASEDPAVVQQALELGAAAFLLKHVDPADLAGAIRRALRGDLYRSASVFAEAAAAAAGAAGLTRKQHEVLNLLASGLTNRAIARELGVGEKTVKYHTAVIYRQLDVRSRTQAIVKAHQMGIVADPLLQIGA